MDKQEHLKGSATNGEFLGGLYSLFSAEAGRQIYDAQVAVTAQIRARLTDLDVLDTDDITFTLNEYNEVDSLGIGLQSVRISVERDGTELKLEGDMLNPTIGVVAEDMVQRETTNVVAAFPVDPDTTEVLTALSENGVSVRKNDHENLAEGETVRVNHGSNARLVVQAATFKAGKYESTDEKVQPGVYWCGYVRLG
jgi:hypothetical protein